MEKTQKELLLLMERDIRRCANEDGMVSMKDIEREFAQVLTFLDEEAFKNTPIKKFIFVEDGTVDTDELEEELRLRSPETKLVVYRQGGRPPECVEVGGVK